MLKTWTTNEMEKDMVEPHGEESRIEWLISCVRWKETAAHPMSWLAVTFTTQEINSLIPPGRAPCGFKILSARRPEGELRLNPGAGLRPIKNLETTTRPRLATRARARC